MFDFITTFNKKISIYSFFNNMRPLIPALIYKQSHDLNI